MKLTSSVIPRVIEAQLLRSKMQFYSYVRKYFCPSLMLDNLKGGSFSVDTASASCGPAAILLFLFVEVIDPLLGAQKVNFSAARQEEDQVVGRLCLLRLQDLSNLNRGPDNF